MPMIGYGTFQITDAKQCRSCVADALAAGYRLVDTAAAYGNEEAVGEAVRQSGIARSELFITTKLWVQDAGYDSTLEAFDRSLKKLGLSYLDLYLIHQPFSDYYGAWRAMERLYEEGAVRAIGVSNFSPDRLVDLCLNQRIRPMVNQIELHPFYQQPEALQVMESYGVVPQAGASFGGPEGHLPAQDPDAHRAEKGKEHRAGHPAVALPAGNSHHPQNGASGADA